MNILNDLGELPLPAIIMFGLSLGGSMPSVKPGAVVFLRAVRGFINGVVFGGMATVVAYMVVVGMNYVPSKLGFLVVAFACAYLAQEIRGIVDAMGKYLSKYRGRIVKQFFITVLEFILNKLKP